MMMMMMMPLPTKSRKGKLLETRKSFVDGDMYTCRDRNSFILTLVACLMASLPEAGTEISRMHMSQ
jgi:hypothetical protein